MANENKNKTSGLSSVGVMIIGITCLMIASLMMFFPNLKTTDGWQIYSAARIFWSSDADPDHGIWPVFIGYMLIFLSGIATIIMALPSINYSYKFEKRIFRLLSVLEFIGGALIACICLFYSWLCGGTLTNLTVQWGLYLAIFFTAAGIVCNFFVIRKDRV